MKRRILCGLLAASFATAGVLVVARPSEADYCYGRGVVVRRYRPAYRYCGPRPYYHRGYDDDDGVSVGTVLLGAAAGYGAYRLYKDYHHDSDDDD